MPARRLPPNFWSLCACFALHFFLASYFLADAGGANPRSRAMPAVTWVLGGTWAIDPLAHFTQDYCFIDGHAYTDKAPLSSWVVVPFVWLGKAAGVAFDNINLHSVNQAVLVGNLVTGSLPFVGVLILLLLAHGTLVIPRAPHVEGRTPAALLVMALCYGTYLFAYAGCFFGHMLAAFFLLAAAMARRHEHFVACGVLLGLAFLTEYPTAIALAIWLVHAVFERRFRAAAQLCAGFAPAALVLGLYNQTLTHAPWVMTYKFTAAPQFGAMHEMYGFGLPHWRTLYELTLGPRRGLLMFAPALLMVLFPVFIKERGRAFRIALTHPEVSVGLALLALNASYFVWWGGEAFGPRHLVPGVVLWIYAAIPRLLGHRAVRATLILAVGTHAMCWLAKATRWHNLGQNETPWALVPDIEMGHYSDLSLLTQLGWLTPTQAVWLWPLCFGLGVWATLYLLRTRAS